MGRHLQEGSRTVVTNSQNRREWRKHTHNIRKSDIYRNSSPSDKSTGALPGSTRRPFPSWDLLVLFIYLFIYFDVWSRSMANTYQRNKQDFIYRNGCVKEISKEIKVKKE
jgi:hypothetical protein